MPPRPPQKSTMIFGVYDMGICRYMNRVLLEDRAEDTHQVSSDLPAACAADVQRSAAPIQRHVLDLFPCRPVASWLECNTQHHANFNNLSLHAETQAPLNSTY